MPLTIPLRSWPVLKIWAEKPIPTTVVGHRHVGSFWEAASLSQGAWWDQDFISISPAPEICARPPCCTPLIPFCDREGACSVASLCDPMDWSPPGSSVHGILQPRILEWVAVSYSQGSSRPRDGPCVSCPGHIRRNGRDLLFLASSSLSLALFSAWRSWWIPCDWLVMAAAAGQAASATLGRAGSVCP